jgi:hypothetical protein
MMIREGKGVPKPRYQCWVKATDAEAGPPRYSASWALARRARLRVFSDRLECGDWIIPSSEVQDAVLFEARQWFIPVFILSLQTSRRTYQFGINPWVRVSHHLPFACRHERVRLGYSAFSIGARVVLLAYLAYTGWRWFSGASSP